MEMTANGWIQILFFFGAILAVTVPLGAFLYRVLEGHDHFLKRPLGWLERLCLSTGRRRRRRAVLAGLQRAGCSPSAPSRCS